MEDPVLKSSKIANPSIRGVLYHDDVMRPWSDLNNDTSETNYGRRTSCSVETVNKFAKRLTEEGIDFVNHPPVYVDAMTGARLDGELRWLASQKIGQQEWNMCSVSFDDARARIEFCTKINNRKNPIDRDNCIADIESAVRELWKLDILENKPVDDAWFRKEVYEMSDGSGDISTREKNKLIATFTTELHAKYGIKQSKGGERFLQWKRSVFNRIDAMYTAGVRDNRTLDPWYYEVFKNKNKIVVCLEHYTFNSVTYKIIESLEKCSHISGEYNLQEPVNFAFSVNIPTDKDTTLDDVRESMFTVLLTQLEEYLLAMKPQIAIGGRMYDMKRKHFPWNHPDARHVFIPQDKVTETDPYSFIRIPNRGFN